jgi:hypothetical protein
MAAATVVAVTNPNRICSIFNGKKLIPHFALLFSVIWHFAEREGGDLGARTAPASGLKRCLKVSLEGQSLPRNGLKQYKQ